MGAAPAHRHVAIMCDIDTTALSEPQSKKAVNDRKWKEKMYREKKEAHVMILFIRPEP